MCKACLKVLVGSREKQPPIVLLELELLGVELEVLEVGFELLEVDPVGHAQKKPPPFVRR